MSTLTEAAAACCACLRVHWTETKHPGGEVSGRWLCTLCGQEFITPAQLPGLRADLETAANVAHNQAERLDEYRREVERREEYLATADARVKELQEQLDAAMRALEAGGRVAYACGPEQMVVLKADYERLIASLPTKRLSLVENPGGASAPQP